VALAEALALQADAATRGVPLGGCTDLMVQWEGGAMPERALQVKDLPELQGVTEDGGRVVVGAAVTHRELRNHELVRRYAPALAEAAATIGGYQMQAQGTIGGSIANASPAGDIAPSLLAYDSSVVVASLAGERTLTLEQFCTGYRTLDLKPDELIVRFIIPKCPEGYREGFRKLGPRAAQAISKVMAAYRGMAADGVVTDFRVAFGSVAATAVRLHKLEAWLKGKTMDEKMLDEAEYRASDEVTPITDIRSTAAYRKWVTGRLVRGFLEEL
jgi:carbon-monoxide dehydrogenase medium subunit